jgi:nucleoid-associated protein YgaU
MSAPNPFQIPTCFKLDLEQRRRERFKKTVVTAVIVSVAVVIGLLIEGCVSEKSHNAADQNRRQDGEVQNTIETPGLAPTKTLPPAWAQPMQPAAKTISTTSLPMQPCPVAMVRRTASPAQPSPTAGGAVYLVKSGDTLSRIARAHKTTVQAIKMANRLDTDRIFAGEKLNIPSA